MLQVWEAYTIIIERRLGWHLCERGCMENVSVSLLCPHLPCLSLSSAQLLDHVQVHNYVNSGEGGVCLNMLQPQLLHAVSRPFPQSGGKGMS